MFRKSLFLGLMVMLGAVLISLMVQGRRQEKKQAAMPVVEVIKQYKPTATRIIAPHDLEVVGSGGAARYVVRNNGTVAYSNPEIEFVYQGKDGRVLERQTVRIDKFIAPGQEVSLDGPLPYRDSQHTKRTLVRIRSAELSAPPASSDIEK